MNVHDATIQALRSVGYITTAEAAEIYGVVSGGKFSEMLKKYGVRRVRIDCQGEHDRSKPMWFKSDVMDFSKLRAMPKTPPQPTLFDSADQEKMVSKIIKMVTGKDMEDFLPTAKR